MKPLIKINTITPLFLTLFALGCLAISESAQAVSPAPDGGYPGGNTAEGQSALFSLTTGGYNTAVGYFSLRSNNTSGFNTAVGAGTLLANTGEENTAVGAGTLLSNTAGGTNTADGAFALFSNTTGNANTADGAFALYSKTDGNGNVAIGYSALYNITTGSGNIALGSGAGLSHTTGSDNIDIGNSGGGGGGTIRIGTTGVQTATYIAGIAGQTVGAGGSTCYVDNDGKLGVFLSARRFKTDIADMGNASEVLLALRPVTFHYKPELDKTGIPQFGLVAEDVAKVNPDLVTHNAKGELSTVRYEAINAMLLNEFLKEHRKVEKQGAAIAEQRTDFQTKIDRLEAIIARQQRRLDEQAAQIEKVSAQAHMNNSVTQVAVRNH